MLSVRQLWNAIDSIDTRIGSYNTRLDEYVQKAFHPLKKEFLEKKKILNAERLIVQKQKAKELQKSRKLEIIREKKNVKEDKIASKLNLKNAKSVKSKQKKNSPKSKKSKRKTYKQKKFQKNKAKKINNSKVRKAGDKMKKKKEYDARLKKEEEKKAAGLKKGKALAQILKQKIDKPLKDYESFFFFTLEDVYTKDDLEKSLHYQIKSFASVYLENTADGFKIQTLPNLAQTSCINKILVEDFNKDGHLDALIAGNLHASEVETPRSDAGVGLLLLGNGKGDLTPMQTTESGLLVSGDVKDIVKIKIKGIDYLVVAKNSDLLQFVEVQNRFLY